MTLEEFLLKKPFSASQEEKKNMFRPLIKEAAIWHFEKSEEFKKMCQNNNFDPYRDFELESLPYFPVTIFKKFDLLSVPKSKIIKILFSSSTSGTPSKIMIDKITADNQVKALNNILSDFLGNKRRHFIIFDTEEIIKSKNRELSSRGTAVRGMLSLAKKLTFLLDDDLRLDEKKIKEVFSETESSDPACFFGFSWLLYKVLEENKKPNFFPKFPDSLILHIGGWKKLQDLAVSKEDFNRGISDMLNVKEEKVVDLYGMTEQLGTVYPDCEKGFKHAPLYSEIIIRNINTLKPAPVGEVGFIELISPIPRSYPGIALVSDDMGKIVGIDTCPCGRKGKYFVFEKRAEEAELKGCGDVLSF